MRSWLDRATQRAIEQIIVRPLDLRLPIRIGHLDWWITPEGALRPVIAGGAANTSPIFPLTPNNGFATITAANTATDGTGTVATLITAGGNGARLDRVLLIPMGTNTGSKAYLFLNNGGAQGTAANNAFLRDIPLAGTTASNTALIGAPLEVVLSLGMASTWTLNATLATAVATGWKVMAFAGNY